jgi:hypothetical protein
MSHQKISVFKLRIRFLYPLICVSLPAFVLMIAYNKFDIEISSFLYSYLPTSASCRCEAGVPYSAGQFLHEAIGYLCYAAFVLGIAGTCWRAYCDYVRGDVFRKICPELNP